MLIPETRPRSATYPPLVLNVPVKVASGNPGESDKLSIKGRENQGGIVAVKIPVEPIGGQSIETI
jgi:hypothetical protein